MIKITLPDGSIREYSAPVTALKIAEDIGPKLAEEAICAEVNNKMVDINYPIDTDATVVIHTFNTEKGKEVYWHSTAHLMAQAVKQLFPEVKIAIGPAIEQGFYYDFDRDESFTEEDLQKIEAKMQELSTQALPYYRTELSKAEAIKLFSEMNETYKLELLEDIPEGEIISSYRQGDFIDLCRGPHLPDTGKIKAIKLLRTSGAYWRGDEKKQNAETDIWNQFSYGKRAYELSSFPGRGK